MVISNKIIENMLLTEFILQINRIKRTCFYNETYTVLTGVKQFTFCYFAYKKIFELLIKVCPKKFRKNMKDAKSYIYILGMAIRVDGSCLCRINVRIVSTLIRHK